MSDAQVIIGGGLAGAKAAEALRDQGYDGAIVLIAAEQHLPYERPPLSKGYLAGSDERASAFTFDADWYLSHDIDLRVGVRADRIDRDAHQVHLDDGSSVAYTKLLLATGSASRHLDGAEGALYLRTIDESERIRDAIGEGRHLVIVGGGWIGLEVAATARQAGTDVTVIEPQSSPLAKILGSRIGDVFADLHREHGVDLRLGVGVDTVAPRSVTTDDGDQIPADAVLVGIGAVPNVELARDAGLEVSNGVDVDAGLRTSDPDVYAVGDIANHDHPTLGRLRVEHWANAQNQPAVAVANMLGGSQVYDRLPYFFSDQYDLGMEYRGLASEENDVVVRGDTATREFLAFWLDGGAVVAGMNVNIWDQGDAVADLIASGRRVDVDKLADPNVPLESV
ncbi:FAD-dependent oxidoreductase [Gordonia sp. HY002]|uniref:NAD(P)/FAD-dependent oxidoreductase n=1 Tax=Gordonia zhenghanii TaxID=2911516 RepID=UPI001EEF93E0|nr:FAD-dependent oxidoreductase [Gordonia zhenghanii]MCF8569586.1 FAD-dependent oxidoreductase [Gordonia zhenghanii]MCF8602893.1 FAD-dependent oxidoreductase [Gordonia zhenghanii]